MEVEVDANVSGAEGRFKSGDCPLWADVGILLGTAGRLVGAVGC